MALSAQRLPEEETLPRWVGRPPSSQELASLALLVQGFTNDEIGARLGITEETVKRHVTALLRKSGAANRADLTARALADKVVDLPPPED
jgi:DNA-binding NarL/FixJ family response regulator